MKSLKLNTLFITLITASILAVFGAALPAQAQTNLLVDGGFESNPLGAYIPTLNSGTLGVWADEAANITTGGAPDSAGVIPYLGSTKMLRITGTGSAWQTVQLTDLSSIPGGATAIDTGLETYDLNAFFTTGKGATGTLTGQVILSFYSGPALTGLIRTDNAALVLDGDPATWENIQKTGTVPIGTRYFLSQVVYRDNTGQMGTNAGFVDAASLTVIPEPSSLALLGLGASTLFLRRRRHACA